MNIDINEKIFIAGSTGMVGSSIKRILLKRLSNRKNGSKILCPNRKELDLLNYENVNKWFKENKPSIVIIAAAKVGGILANSTMPYEFLLENIKIQINIIENSWKYGAKKVLFLGSSCIYPKFSQQPIKEEYLLDSKLEDTNQWYAIAKITGIKLCESLVNQYSFDAISLMPSNLYGIGDNYNLSTSHVLPAFINRFQNAKDNNLKQVTCWGTGNALREFLYVDDLAEACIYSLEKWSTLNENAPLDEDNKKLYWLNVGSGEEISIRNLAEKIANVIGYKGEINWDKTKPDGTPRKILDSSRLNKIGWSPKINLDEGLKITIAEYRKFYQK